MSVPTLHTVGEDHLGELLPLMRAYCEFYGAAPPDEDLLAMARTLIADPVGEGVQILARDGDRPVGFATIFWTWSTLRAARIGVMNDLFVDRAACAGRVRAGGRGARGVARLLASGRLDAMDLDSGRGSI